MLVSIVVPVYNEEENIAIFYNAVTKVMTGLPYEYELIYVDDGSTDSSVVVLREIAKLIRELRSCYWHGTLVIRLR